MKARSAGRLRPGQDERDYSLEADLLHEFVIDLIEFSGIPALQYVYLPRNTIEDLLVELVYRHPLGQVEPIEWVCQSYALVTRALYGV